jgi:hypothetical protein
MRTRVARPGSADRQPGRSANVIRHQGGNLPNQMTMLHYLAGPFLALGIAAAAYCIGAGIEAAGAHIGAGSGTGVEQASLHFGHDLDAALTNAANAQSGCEPYA